MIGEGAERGETGSEWAATRQGQARDKTKKIKWRPRGCLRGRWGGAVGGLAVVGSLKGYQSRAAKLFLIKRIMHFKTPWCTLTPISRLRW